MQLLVGIEQRYLETLRQEGVDLGELGRKYQVEMEEQTEVEIADFRGSIYLFRDVRRREEEGQE